MIATTDEMDKITHEERIALIGMCAECGQWVSFTRGESFECACGSSKNIQTTIHTQRTFDKERAKKETAKHLKNRKK